MNYLNELENILNNKENFVQVNLIKAENGNQIMLIPTSYQKSTLIFANILPFFLLAVYINVGITSEQILIFFAILLFSNIIVYMYLAKLNKVTIDFKLKELKIENNSMFNKMLDNQSIKFEEIMKVEAIHSNKSQDKFVLKTKNGTEYFLFAGSTLIKGSDCTKLVAKNITELIKSYKT